MFRTVSYRINEEKNGIELIYGYIPPLEIRTLLKKNGWRWNPTDEVWYIKFSENALKFAQNQSYETEKRQSKIEKMPVFYKKHCGCEESYLPFLEPDVFDKYVRTGSLVSIAKELLIEHMFDDAVSLLQELYIQASKNEDYKKELLSKIPKDLYSVAKDGSIKLNNPKKNVSKGISTQIGLQQGTFWKSLEIFGINLQPVDRIAYYVSNFRKKSLANNASYYCASSVKERQLLFLVDHLTLDYNDTLTQIIKNHLKSEIQEILKGNEEKNYYLLALYALILNEKEQAYSFLLLYINQITPRKVILNIELKIWMERYKAKTFDFGVREIILKIRYNEKISRTETIQINVFDNKVECNYLLSNTGEIKKYAFFCENKKWLEFANEFFNNFKMLSLSASDFSKVKNKEKLDTKTDNRQNYEISICTKDSRIQMYVCEPHCYGIDAVNLIKKYFAQQQEEYNDYT